MKKIVSLLLVLCMLMAVAFAAETKVGVDMQPQAAVEFTLMEDRHTLVDDDLRNRMQWAYAAIHATGHFGEMAAKDHENGIIADVNRELAEMGLDLTAYDYMIYDSFELQLADEYASMLENGGSLAVDFKLNLERDVHLVVLQSSDEATWKCIDHENVVQNGDNASVSFDEMGTVLFLIEIENKPMNEDAEPDSNFTRSVTGKAAPDVVAPKGAAEGIIARIYNELDEMISEVPDNGYLVITPVSRRDTAEDKEVRERLEWAYNQIMTTPRLGDLAGEDGLGIAAKIDAVLAGDGFNDLDSDDMIVRDLFNASLYGTEYVDALNDESHYIEITFDLQLDRDDPLVILVTNDNKSWQVLDADDYIVNADGTVTMYLEELGTIAVLVDSEENVVDKDSVKAPKTGED